MAGQRQRNTDHYMEQTIDARDVAEYLRRNPQFFAEYADLFAEIFVPHPHGGHAIPIAERQIVTLREKNAALERRLSELIRYGRENDTIDEKLHRVTLALFPAGDLETTLAVLYASLREDFDVPQVAARLWPRTHDVPELPEFAAVSDEVKTHTVGLGVPYCGRIAPLEVRGWFAAPEACTSFALLPLRTTRMFGLVALASDDPQRFQAGMGKAYLTRLSELASVAAARYLPLV
jgi:uncharacterized protein YigA (DUF484 family)